MDEFTQALIIIGLFLLRLGVPIAITAAVAYLFHRLDLRWERQAGTQPMLDAAHQLAAAADRPCWEEKGCAKEQMAKCPACKFTDIPCWLARLKVEGRLPAGCANCGRFAPVPVAR
jgi:hypothetical protein